MVDDSEGGPMNIGVAKERAAGERRVALGPESTAKLVKAGAQVLVERGAGSAAGFPDAVFEKAGASLVDDAGSLYAKSTIVLRVQPPTIDEVALLPEGSVLISSMPAATSSDLVKALAARRITAFALEKVPRITRAQSMDMLSSQSTVSGYKAVLIGAAALPKFLPSLTTAAGSIPPARVFVLGAGVAGLQAIATARRLGAIVSAFDVRAAAAEQVMSLGATFVASDLVAADAETKGGYARAQGEEERERTLAAIGRHIVDQDLVITTALIPGRAAPVLITKAMVESMRPGSVIVDLAAEAGGNCELTKPNETIQVNGVTIIGAVNLPATVPFHASQMLSRNVLTLLQHLIKDNTLTIDLNDEITKAMVVTHEGVVV
ncbi:MAG TPA: Re/Si-specific NAD(P)(+) transhydrogenase subunit alpha [Gemmatimonadaceae bacterium]